MSRVAAMLLLLGCAMPLCAGVWDRERPAPDELPDVLEIVAGRFDRFPESYYRKRLERLLPGLDQLPAAAPELSESDAQRISDALPEFDDAAVCCFRLGDFGRAIILLDRKLVLAEALRPTRTAVAQEAARHAKATKAACLQQRWRRDRRDAADLRQARDLLKAVLAEDPHDGDARWSLTEVEWLLGPPAWQPGPEPLYPNLLGLRDAAFRGERDDSAPARNNIAGCLTFLARRICYEAGWLEPDVLYAYSLALALTGRAEEALLAMLRADELLDSGAAMCVQAAPAPAVLRRMLHAHVADVPGREDAAALYAELRSQADAWLQRRNEYVAAGLDAGTHPDTHADFWAAWRPDDAPLPEPGEGEETADPAVSAALLIGGLGGLMMVLLLILGFTVFVGRRTSPPPSVDEI